MFPFRYRNGNRGVDSTSQFVHPVGSCVLLGPPKEIAVVACSVQPFFVHVMNFIRVVASSFNDLVYHALQCLRNLVEFIPWIVRVSIFHHFNKLNSVLWSCFVVSHL